MIGAWLAAWGVMLLLAIANGAVRDGVYGRRISELAAHQISTLAAMALFAVVMWAFVAHWPPASDTAALALGLGWCGLTVAFEFLFFHFVGKHPWAELLANYNVLKGRLWPLLLLWLMLGPWLFRRMQG